MKRSVIITAGGSGKRMGTEIPKQFLVLKDKPVIFHAIQKFLDFDANIELIVVLPEAHVPNWESLCQKYFFTHTHKVVCGGEERFHSIKNGLAEVTGELVAIHDAVRPFVSEQVIENCFMTLEKNTGVIPIISVNESLRKWDYKKTISVNRSDYCLVQTPQCFHTTKIKEAYNQNYQSSFTDDASVFEAAGNKLETVQGNVENIKITTPFDWQIAEALMKVKQ